MRRILKGALPVLAVAAAASAVAADSAPPPAVSAPWAAASGPAVHSGLGGIAANAPKPYRPAPVLHHVDINSASRKELMTLPGIGRAEADRIIANRPYLTKTGLVTKNVLQIGPFVSLKHLVAAIPPKIAAKGKR